MAELAKETSADTPATSRSPAHLFAVWLGLGVQSFGGGVATLALIRRAAVEREGWVDADEFARYWGLVQLAPGINLIALTILLGRRASGACGIALALAGLLLPSAAITALMTALYAHVEGARWVQRALTGIIPATVGLGMLTAAQIAWPILALGRREGSVRFAASAAILAAGAAAYSLLHAPVLAILLGGAAAGAAAHARRPALIRKLDA